MVILHVRFTSIDYFLTLDENIVIYLSTESEPNNAWTSAEVRQVQLFKLSQRYTEFQEMW